jgi:chloramphenicol-sensitive protein RarD
VFREVMPAERWAGFALVWVALVLFTVDLVRSQPRRVSAPTPEPELR